MLVVIALATFFFATAAAVIPPPTLCSPNEKIIFSCALPRGRIASLCLSTKPGSPSPLQYRFGTQQSVELRYPNSNGDLQGSFVESDTSYSGGGEAHIRFSNGGFDYVIFDKLVKYNDPYGIIVRKGSKVVRRLDCKPGGHRLEYSDQDLKLPKETFEQFYIDLK